MSQTPEEEMKQGRKEVTIGKIVHGRTFSYASGPLMDVELYDTAGKLIIRLEGISPRRASKYKVGDVFRGW